MTTTIPSRHASEDEAFATGVRETQERIARGTQFNQNFLRDCLHYAASFNGNPLDAAYWRGCLSVEDVPAPVEAPAYDPQAAGEQDGREGVEPNPLDATAFPAHHRIYTLAYRRAEMTR